MPRPIDADALIGRSVPLEGLDGSGIPYVVRAVPVMFIDDTPTLDYKDLVPQGEWIWNEECECWCCSRCEASALNNYRGLSVESNFCPNCGARMTK